MAFVSITPSANSIVATGDALVVRWSSTSVFPVISFRPANGAQETVSSPSDGGMNAGPGYTVAYDIDGSESLTTFSRDAGWAGSPFVISIWDSVLGTETLISYTLLGEGQYPPDMQPFNDPAEGGTAGVISIQDNGIDEGDATTLNFANNLDVTVSGGTATIVGAAGGAGGGDVSSSETAGTVLDAEVVVFDSTTGKLIKGAGPSVTVDTVNARVSAQGFVATADNITLNDGNVRIQGTRKGINILEADLPSLGGAGYGNYWVRDDTPQAPVFTDDTGTSFDLKGGTVSDGNTSTTLITDGVVFGSTPGAPATYSVAPEQKDSSFLGDDVAIAGGENIGAASGGSVYIRGGASSGSGVNGGVYLAPSNTTELFLGGTGTDLRINDGTGTGTAGYGLISDGTSASWQPNPGGGATDTVAGSNGITNTGDNTDAILTPTYGSAGDTFCQGNDSRLSNSRDPNVHAASHENGSGDEIDVTGLSGLLADPQTVGIEDSGTPDTYDATVLNFGTNMTVTVDAADGTATVNASVSGSVGVNGLGSWNYDNTLTSADPGSGNFRLDNLNPNSATAMYIDSVNGDSQTMDTVLANAEGWRLSFNNASGAKYFSAICGTPSDQTGWWSIPLSDTYGTATLTNTENYTVTLAPSDSFAFAGAAITDNAIVRGDGGGSGVQDSSVTITDGGAVVLSSATSMVQVPERATGPTFAAGTGQFWVKNTSPSSPFFTQDDGTELDLTPTAIGTDTDAIHVDVDSEISNITEKVTPIAADLLVIEDSADSNNKKRVQIGNLPFVANEAQALVVSARSSAGTINPGQVVYLTGWDLTNGVIQVDLADASAAATMPGFGIAQETITSAVTGQVVVSGEITNQVTTGYTEGDFLYVSETAGALTDTKPTGTAIAQHICVVNRAHATEGVLQIVGAGQLTLPSIAENNVWMGNASGVPTETARAGIDTDSVTHIAATTNPHATSLDNLAPGTHAHLEAASVDSGKIFASLQDNQVTSLTDNSTPDYADVVMVEDASTGAKTKVELGNLPGSGNIKARCATTANITIASDLNVSDTIDGVTLADGDRVLVKDQTTASENGIYIAGATPARSFDFDTDATAAAALIIVKEGTVHQDTFWLVTNNDGSDVVGTDDLVIEQSALAGVIDAGQITTGTFDSARISEASVTQHEGAIDHDALFNYDVDEHYPILNSTQASRPAASSNNNKMHVSTDTNVLVRSDGASWNAVTTTTTDADALNSATTTVNVAAATAPTVGQILTATSSTAATWQDNAGGVTGPTTSTIGNIAIWDDATGDSLEDAVASITASGGYQAGVGTLTGAAGGNFVSCTSSGTSDSSILAPGALLWGASDGSGSTINATAEGAMAGGKAGVGGDILASGNASCARGNVLTSKALTASGIASTALSYGTQNVTASGNASFAMSASFSAATTASGDNCMQIGEGTNAEDVSICVGDITSGGIRLIGDGAAAASPQDGDIWQVSGDVSIRSAGSNVTFNLPDITGSRGGNAALASLLTALAAMNLITDSTT